MSQPANDDYSQHLSDDEASYHEDASDSVALPDMSGEGGKSGVGDDHGGWTFMVGLTEGEAVLREVRRWRS
ncbi:hypothetical protein Tco_0978544 [Tanacetum coccineum]|uniref:Uncharacterized protein n=1 Tax=Tanacetum coccineum TaxID=301880 RepID=A0ABQ5ENP8_9ASTR